jgi:hypothetical protein
VKGPEKHKSGWKLFVHPAFSETFDALVAEAARLRTADPEGYKQHPKTKLLKRILDLIEVEITRDQEQRKIACNTLGPNTGIGARQVSRPVRHRYSSWTVSSSTPRSMMKLSAQAGGRNDLYLQRAASKGPTARRLECPHKGSCGVAATGGRRIANAPQPHTWLLHHVQKLALDAWRACPPSLKIFRDSYIENVACQGKRQARHPFASNLESPCRCNDPICSSKHEAEYF